MLKLSIIMQIFLNAEDSQISVQAVNGAKTVIDYAVHSTKLLLEKEIGESDHQRKVRRISEYLKKYKGPADWRKLQQSRILDGGVAEYKYVIDSMESAGLIQIIMDGKNIKEIHLLQNES